MLAVATVGCARSSETEEARGILLDVQSKDLVQAETITLRSDSGVVRTFRVSPEVASDPQHPNPASHLRQHMTVADRVVVRYRDAPDGPVAVQIVDEARVRLPG